MADTALLMIDVQNMYIADDGLRDKLGWGPIWDLDRVVGECAQLLDAARGLDVPVIYTRAVRRDDGADTTPRYARLREVREAQGITFSVSPEHERWKAEIMDAVKPQPGDIVLDKLRWDAFHFTELEPILRNLGVSRLLVAGLQTNVCVESTVRSGLMRNFVVGVPEDAVSTDGHDLHVNALKAMKVLYAEVASWRELIDPDDPWDRPYRSIGYGRD